MKSGQSTQKSLATIVLGFEVIVIFLAGLTVFGLKLTSPPSVAILFTVIVLALDIIAIGIMRRGKAGITLGWILHGIYFIPVFVLVPIGLLALIFGALWVFAMVKGKEVDRLRASVS